MTIQKGCRARLCKDLNEHELRLMPWLAKSGVCRVMEIAEPEWLGEKIAWVGPETMSDNDVLLYDSREEQEDPHRRFADVHSIAVSKLDAIAADEHAA